MYNWGVLWSFKQFWVAENLQLMASLSVFHSTLISSWAHCHMKQKPPKLLHTHESLKKQMPQENNRYWTEWNFMTLTGLFQSPATSYFQSCLEKSMETSKRSCYETVESHGEEARCRGPSFEQPPGKENLWRAA